MCPKLAAPRKIALGLWKRQKYHQKYGKERFYAAVDPTTPPSRGERVWSRRDCPQRWALPGWPC